MQRAVWRTRAPILKSWARESFDLGRAPRLGQLQTKEVDQVVGGGVQEQAEGVGQKAVTAQAVGAKAVLELLDAVLALAAIVVESEDFGGASGAVGNHEAQVGSGGGVLGLVADAALARPTAGAVAGNWRSCAAEVGCGDSAVLAASAAVRHDA